MGLTCHHIRMPTAFSLGGPLIFCVGQLSVDAGPIAGERCSTVSCQDSLLAEFSQTVFQHPKNWLRLITYEPKTILEPLHQVLQPASLELHSKSCMPHF